MDDFSVDTPGDGGSGDSFGLALQSHRLSWGIHQAGRLLHPVRRSCGHNTHGQSELQRQSSAWGLTVKMLCPLTLHGHGEDVADVAVAVGRLALVLAVVGQLDAAEEEAVLVRRHLAAGLL